MKITALNDFSARWWSPPDQENDPPVSFQIRPLDGEQYGEMAQYVRTIDGQQRFGHEAVKLALRYGLMGWRNLRGADGKELEHNLERHACLPLDVRMLVFVQILEISSLDEDQAKNSASPLTSLKTGSDSIA